MVLIYSTIFEKKARSIVSNGFKLKNHISKSKQAKVLNCKTIFQRASKQTMVLNY